MQQDSRDTIESVVTMGITGNMRKVFNAFKARHGIDSKRAKRDMIDILLDSQYDTTQSDANWAKFIGGLVAVSPEARAMDEQTRLALRKDIDEILARYASK